MPACSFCESAWASRSSSTAWASSWAVRPVLTGVGSAIGNLGITQGHYIFGILAASGELIGGLLLLTGAFFRPACLLLLWIMAMALTMHLKRGDGFNAYAHALELAFVFLGLFFAGPGKYSVDGK